MNYVRSEGLSAGSNGGSINDTFSIRFDWKPLRLWRLSSSASWIQRESTVTRGGSNKVTTWTGTASVKHQLTRRSTASANFSYRDQGSNGRVSRNDDFSGYRVSLGLEYRFAPVRF